MYTGRTFVPKAPINRENPIKLIQNEAQQPVGLTSLLSQPLPNQQAQNISPFNKLFLATSQDPQYAFAYAEDINETMKRSERIHLVPQDYMTTQPKINSKFREVLVDWLSSVRGKYGLKPETFALAIAIIDKYLAIRQIEKNLLQLLGCTSLWIAAKYEEIYPPELQDLIGICENTFQRDTFIMMERNILTELKFSITVPYALHFAERYVQALPESFDHSVISQLSLFFLESTYQQYSFVGKLPSMIGAAAVSLALFLSHQPHWHRNLDIATGYSFEQIRPIFGAIWKNCCDVYAQHTNKKNAQFHQERVMAQYRQQGVMDPIAEQLPRVPKAFDSVLRLHLPSFQAIEQSTMSQTISHILTTSLGNEFNPDAVPLGKHPI